MTSFITSVHDAHINMGTLQLTILNRKFVYCVYGQHRLCVYIYVVAQ